MSSWDALNAIGLIGKGRCAPFRARCECWNPETYVMDEADWMVKAPRDGVIGPPEFFREVVGHRLARHFRIGVAPVGVVNLEDDFIESLRGTPLDKYPFEIGLGVGCQYFKGIKTLSRSSRMRPEWMGEVYRLYAFDLLMGNDDRSISNPNCGFREGSIFAYDFERILPDVEQPAWQVSEQKWVPCHIMHQHLQGQPGLWDEFIGLLGDVDENWLRGQTEDLPADWAKTWRVDALIQHIKSAQSETAKLKQQLDICLRKPLPAS